MYCGENAVGPPEPVVPEPEPVLAALLEETEPLNEWEWPELDPVLSVDIDASLL